MKASFLTISRRYLATWFGIALCAAGSTALADEDPLAALVIEPTTKEAFSIGWEAARVGDLEEVDQAMAVLYETDPNSPLLPYLQFEALRQRIDQASVDEVSRFLAQYRDWSFASSLERNWLRSLGRQGQVATIEQYLNETGQVTRDAEIRCHLVAGKVANPPAKTDEQYQVLSAEIESLWTTGTSQHKACDPAFRWWRGQSNPSPAVAWSRFLLAIEANERSLASYLQRYLTSEQRIWAQRWLLMHRYPHRALAQARRWPDNEAARQLVEWGLLRQARQDWARAEGHWALLSERLAFDPQAIEKISKEIALFQAVALDENAMERIDQLNADALDEQILTWRSRVAMAHGRWDEVYRSIQRMPASAQSSAKWIYWRGRALAEMGRPDALLAYAAISGEANYYGFLSAKKLGQALSLCPESLLVDESIRQKLIDHPALIRAMALYQVGLMGHARATWFHWLNRLPSTEQHQAALLASEFGWHDRAIATLASTGMMRAYRQRFPLGHQTQIEQASTLHDVDVALVYGLMRAESAMQTDARSPVGAMGLLQLMPSTARAVARRQGLSLSSADELHDPSTNIALGVAHLAELSERFGQDWRFVAAAYNAGINAVERWLDRPNVPEDLPADVWIETLPFYETRDYVPRVLAFATIYEWQLQRSPSLLAKHIGVGAPPGVSASQGFVCAAP